MGRVIRNYTPPSARPTKPTIFTPIRGIYCRGTSGNDVEAGPLLKSSAYTNLKNAVAAITTKMQRTFDGGLSTFQHFLSTSGGEFDTAIDNYKADLGAAGAKVFEITHPTTAQLAALKEAADSADAATYRDTLGPMVESWNAQASALVGGASATYQVVSNILTDEPSENTSTAANAGTNTNTLKADVNNGGGAQGQSQICFVNYSLREQGASVLVPGISGSNITAAMRGNGAVAGVLRESIANYADDAVIVGDPVAVERRFSMYARDDASGRAGLQAAWSKADETAFKAYIQQKIDDEEATAQAAFEQACLIWPMVYAAYRIAANFDFLAGTKWSGYGAQLARKYAKIRPFLLSGYNSAETGNPSNWIPLPIPIEISEDGGSTWHIVTYYNGLKLSPDGQYFLVDNLREINSTYRTWSGSVANPSDMKPNWIRATLAVETDFRITATAGGSDDPNKTAQRIMSDGDVKVAFVSVGNPGDYVEWLRHSSSQPYGAQIAAFGAADPTLPASFPAKCTANNELFSDRPGELGAPTGRMVTHALNRLQDVKRIEGSGWVEFRQFDPGMLPGLCIKGVSNAGIPVSGVVKAVTIEAGRQAMIVTLG